LTKSMVEYILNMPFAQR